MMFTASGMQDSSGTWSASGSRSLADLLQSSASKDDDELAYVIDVAARRGLLALGSLDEFFRLIPRLADRPVVLDAAIDAVIQIRERAGESRSKLIADLQASYPEHREAIQVAAALSSVVAGSTRGGASAMGAPRSLPEDLGPATPDGSPRYSLREVLGSGSQGQVYLAVDRLLSKEGAPSYVAVKFLRGHVILQADQRTAAEEAIKARRISHPGVARVIDRGVTQSGESYVVFEHVDGGNAEHHIRRHGPFTDRDAAKLVVVVARGIQAIHAAGLFHCDLKPSNVLLTRSGEPRITDFGLARWVTDRGIASPGDEQGNGAIGFAAPEQFEGTQPLTAACDVYALGGLLLYLATGAVPNGETPTDARRNVFTGSGGGPINPAAVGRLHDPVLRSICARALHRDPRERHTSAEAFANDVERWLRHEPIEWIPQPASQRVTRWLKRERKAVAAAGVFLLVAAGGIAWGGQQYIEGREQRLLKEKAQIREQAEQQRVQQMRTSLLTGLDTVRTARQQGLAQDWVGQVVMLEGALGPHFFKPGDVGIEHWSRRISVADELSVKARAEDGSPTVTSLQWLFLAGVWDARTGNYRPAAARLRTVADGWKSVAPADDAIREFAEKCWAACIVLDAESAATDRAAATEILRTPDGPLASQGGTGIAEVLARARAMLETTK